MKPDTVEHYEALVAAGESVYFDPVELDEIYHYYVEQNDLSKVEEVLRLALSLHPDDYIVQQMDAEYTLNCGDTEEALKKLDVFFSEQNPFQCILRSAALAKLGRDAEALEMAEKALIDEDPKEYVAYDLGLGFMNANQFTTALHYYERSLTHHPDDVKTLSGILYCQLQLQETNGLAELSEHILQLDPFNFEAWIAKGNLLAEQEKFSEAIDAYEYAVAIAPDEADPLVMKARCLDCLNRKDEAILVLREAADKAYDEQHSSVCCIIAGLLKEQGKTEEAKAACWDSIRDLPDNPVVLMRAAYTFQELGANSEALIMVKAAHERDPEDFTIMGALAECLSTTNQFEEAIHIYEKIAQREPNASTYALWGSALMSLGRCSEALKRFKQANEYDELWQTYVLMASCDVELRHFKKMEEHFRMAYALGPDVALPLFEKLCPATVKQMQENGFLDMLAKEREKWIRKREKELRLLAEQRKNKKI